MLLCSVVRCSIVAFAPIATAHTVTKNNDTLVKTRHVKRQNQFSNYCSIFYTNNAANNIIIKFSRNWMLVLWHISLCMYQICLIRYNLIGNDILVFHWQRHCRNPQQEWYYWQMTCIGSFYSIWRHRSCKTLYIINILRGLTL